MNTTKTTVTWKSLTPRERDALVAKEVMGWTSDEVNIWRGDNADGRMHYPPHPCYAVCDNRYFKPTTSIADAFEVVEKMQEKGFPFSCTDCSKDGLPRWIVRFSVFSGGADTFMDACCLSALRACGVEVQA